MKILLIFNPVSGNTDNQPVVDELQNSAAKNRVALEVYRTTGEKDREAIEQRLKGMPIDVLVAMGGDGTINSTAMIARKHGLVFGIIPGGTSNGLAKDLGIASDPQAAFRDILDKKHVLNLDMICVNETHYLLHLGDVGANTRFLDRKERSQDGTLHDLGNFVQEFMNDHKFNYELEVNGQLLSGSASMISFCNARKYGTGVPLTQSASPTDGKFELVIFEDINVATLVTSALAALQESLFSSKDREIHCTTSAVLRLESPQQWQLDGELMPHTRELRLQVVPEQVQVICGEDCVYLPK